MIFNRFSDRVALGYSLATFGPIIVEQGWRKVRVRLCGIDAPELAQPLGVESRNRLRQFIASAGNQVILYGNDTDRYGRRVAEVFVPDPTPQQPEQEKVLNDAMVRVGIAYHYAKYAIADPMGVQDWSRQKLRRSQKIGCLVCCQCGEALGLSKAAIACSKMLPGACLWELRMTLPHCSARI